MESSHFQFRTILFGLIFPVFLVVQLGATPIDITVKVRYDKTGKPVKGAKIVFKKLLTFGLEPEDWTDVYSDTVVTNSAGKATATLNPPQRRLWVEVHLPSGLTAFYQMKFRDARKPDKTRFKVEIPVVFRWKCQNCYEMRTALMFDKYFEFSRNSRDSLGIVNTADANRYAQNLANLLEDFPDMNLVLYARLNAWDPGDGSQFQDVWMEEVKKLICKQGIAPERLLPGKQPEWHERGGESPTLPMKNCILVSPVWSADRTFR